MLKPHDRSGLKWTARCDFCLESLPKPWVFEGTQEEAITYATGVLFWELVPVELIVCLECSRKRREVPFPLTSRGRVAKRRRR